MSLSAEHKRQGGLKGTECFDVTANTSNAPSFSWRHIRKVEVGTVLGGFWRERAGCDKKSVDRWIW